MSTRQRNWLRAACYLLAGVAALATLDALLTADPALGVAGLFAAVALLIAGAAGPVGLG